MHSELISWLELLKNRKLTVALFSVLTVLLLSVFFLLVWGYQILEKQISQFNSSLEIIVELDEDLNEEQGQFIKQEIERLEMVKAVEYWAPSRSAQYVDNRVLSGYLSFLKKNELGVPFNALLRVSLKSLSMKGELEKIISEKYPGRLFFIDPSAAMDGQSFSENFVQSMDYGLNILKIFIPIILSVIVLIQIYFKMALLAERGKGFNFLHIVHLSSPYCFWPALLFSIVMSFILVLVSMLVIFLTTGNMFWLLSFMLFIVFVLLDLILVWLGRFVRGI